MSSNLAKKATRGIAQKRRRNGPFRYLRARTRRSKREESSAMRGSRPSGGTAKVIDNSPAEKAGILPGDVVTKVNDFAIRDARIWRRSFPRCRSAKRPTCCCGGTEALSRQSEGRSMTRPAPDRRNRNRSAPATPAQPGGVYFEAGRPRNDRLHGGHGEAADAAQKAPKRDGFRRVAEQPREKKPDSSATRCAEGGQNAGRIGTRFRASVAHGQAENGGTASRVEAKRRCGFCVVERVRGRRDKALCSLVLTPVGAAKRRGSRTTHFGR